MLLAVDVVYGREERVWAALVTTLLALSAPHTLILMAHGNGAAPGVHAMRGPFYERAAEHFDAACLAADAEHPGCAIHCLVRKPASCSKTTHSTTSASALQEAAPETPVAGAGAATAGGKKRARDALGEDARRKR